MEMVVFGALWGRGPLLNLAQLGGTESAGWAQQHVPAKSGAKCGTSRAKASKSEPLFGPWASWDHLGASEGSPGGLLGFLGASWGPPGASWGPPGGLLGSPGGLLGAPWRLRGDLGLQKASKSEACWPEYTLLRRFLMVSKTVPFSRKRAEVRKTTLLRRIWHIL